MYEKIFKRKGGSDLILRRVALIGSYALLLIFMVIVIVFYVPTLLVPTITVAVVAMAVGIESALILLTKKFLSEEYEYCVASGEVSFSSIYGKRSRRLIFEEDLKEISEIGEYNDTSHARLSSLGIDRCHMLIPNVNSSSPLCYLLQDRDGERTVVVFEFDEEMMTALKKENSHAFHRAIYENKKYENQAKGENI